MLILASQSKSRQRLLKAAGVEFSAVPADIDEDEIKRAEPDGYKAALKLAEIKAETVSEKYQDAFVIGADQILELDGKHLPKRARRFGRQIRRLRLFSEIFRTNFWIIISERRATGFVLRSEHIIWKSWELSWLNASKGIIFRYWDCRYCLCLSF